MRVPAWFFLAIGVLVALYGVYRIRLAIRPAQDPGTRPRRGLGAMSNRTHAMMGVVFLVMGGVLIATSYGWNPFRNTFAPKDEPPSKAPVRLKEPAPAKDAPTGDPGIREPSPAEGSADSPTAK